jgi:hypothetical protein
LKKPKPKGPVSTRSLSNKTRYNIFDTTFVTNKLALYIECTFLYLAKWASLLTHHVESRLLTLLTNTRLGWKGLPGTNGLVYCENL